MTDVKKLPGRMLVIAWTETRTSFDNDARPTASRKAFAAVWTSEATLHETRRAENHVATMGGLGGLVCNFPDNDPDPLGRAKLAALAAAEI